MPPPRRAAWYCWEELAEEQLNDLLSRRLIEADRIAEARDVLRDVLATDPTNAAALDLQKQIGAQ